MNKRLVIGLAGLAGAAGLTLAVSGCGGGSGTGVAESAAAQPAAAQPATIAQALAYIAEQKSLPNTDIDPQTLRQMLPAADDTIEPSPI